MITPALLVCRQAPRTIDLSVPFCGSFRFLLKYSSEMRLNLRMISPFLFKKIHNELPAGTKLSRLHPLDRYLSLSHSLLPSTHITHTLRLTYITHMTLNLVMCYDDHMHGSLQKVVNSFSAEACLPSTPPCHLGTASPFPGTGPLPTLTTWFFKISHCLF